MRTPRPRGMRALRSSHSTLGRIDRTRVVLTADKLFVVHGTLRRRAAAVRLEKIQTVEMEQSLLGRLLGYGTIVAGDLEISCVASPRDVQGFLSKSLSGT